MKYCVFETSAGWAGISSSDMGLRRVILPRENPVETATLLGISHNYERPAPRELKNIVYGLQGYFRGERISFAEKLDFTGATPFECEVWEAARLIPFGETRSYSWIAGRIGDVRSARAVGNALGRNRLPVIVPCHRVLHRDGGLGGFSAGLETKKFLLELEGGTISPGRLSGSRNQPRIFRLTHLC